jgi:hypothetical protein
MKRTMFASLLVAAACSGSSKKPEPVVADPGTGQTPADPFAGDPADPKLAARTAYSNPGGKWMPQQMALAAHVETFRQLGVDLPAAQLADPLADPLASIVSIGGCSASFVSPEGLVVTNHHCVQDHLQFNSTPEQNLVVDGYLAKTRADEKSAGPANKVWVVQAYTDVTKQMRDGLEAIADPIARKTEVETRLKGLIAECEKGRPGIRCDVNPFFGGGEWLLYEKLEIRDVRLVYIPRRSIGKYGGEIDNWRWPRHTGDFAFLRAYVGKDGAPADFSPDNVPYRPAHYLKVSTAGVADHDFVMVAGYPGKTTRTATAAEIRHDVEWGYPYAMAQLEQRYAVDEEMIKLGGDTAIKAGVDKQRAQNYMEKYRGVLAGLAKTPELLQRKDALDAQIKEWAAQPGREAWKAQIEKLEQLGADKRATARVDFDRDKAFSGSKLLVTALSLVRWAEERPKADAARKPGYQDRDMPKTIAAAQAFERGYNRALDRALFKLSLTRALDLPEADRPWLATMLGAKNGQPVDAALIDKALDKLYAGTKLEAEAVRIKLLKTGTTKQLKASKDPFIKLAVALWPTVKAQEKLDDARAGELALVGPSYPLAMREVLGGNLPPDANSTLRISYGTVKSFKPGSTAEADWPFTTATQLAAKATGEDPFNAPAAELDAIKAKNYGPYAQAALGGELPVDFLSDLDITNGNSGSATLDGKGQLVGLAFDGTIDGVASDIVFNSETTRTIHVDVRYILWVMDAVDHADHLLTEMGVTPAIN